MLLVLRLSFPSRLVAFVSLLSHERMLSTALVVDGVWKREAEANVVGEEGDPLARARQDNDHFLQLDSLCHN
jgi:hypothetical protein